jgi:hypothetical protein
VTDEASDAAGGADPSDRADDGLEHLQTAAREMIKAARAFLDVAEDLVSDPKTADRVLGLIDTAVGAAGRASGRAKGTRTDGDDPMEHIQVD